jgi:excisionase family DNA binding protein
MDESFADEAESEFFAELSRSVHDEAQKLGAAEITVDLWFLCFLLKFSRFGYFTFGPISLDVHLIEDIVASTTVRGTARLLRPPMSDDTVRYSQCLMEEVRRSGRSRIDELHVLLALMRVNEGLPGRVFSELGVTPEQVEEFARDQREAPTALEKLFSPEEAAAYLNVHVQTVRSWIRSGRLRARRLAGQRALRITASDLQSVLEPLDQDDLGPATEA